MRAVEVFCTDCSLSIGSPCPTCNDEGLFDAYILEPHESVIDARRVKELLSDMENDAIIRGGQALMEQWGELKKELGIIE